jgi:ABC-type molybdate transport system substrate-binding protein
MKMRQVVFGVLGLVGLVIAFAVGRYFPPAAPRSIHDKQITVSSAGSGKCSVDSPYLNVRYASGDHVQWQSADNQYSISFVNQVTPLDPKDLTFTIDSAHPSKQYHLQKTQNYYPYDVLDQNGKVCKASTDVQDPGLNVKQ